MSIQIEFSPSAPEGLVFSGGINLAGHDVVFEFMDSSRATLSDIPEGLAPACLSALAGLLQVTVSVIGGDCFSSEKVIAKDKADQPSDDTFSTNVFELNLPDATEDLISPYMGLAEVIPIKPKQVQVSSAICLWETLFAKPSPVKSLADWATDKQSYGYIYIPNDLSMPEGAQESYINNAEFTQIMLTAYQNACLWKKMDPEIVLQDGQGPFKVLALDPMSGVQHHVPGEKAARLANSSLQGDDNNLIPLFLSALQSMGPDDYTSPVAHLNVLAKAELTLTGASNLVTNHSVVTNLCRFVETEFSRSGSFMLGNSVVLNAVLFTLRQMVIEGLVLHQSKEQFMAYMYRAKLDRFSNDLSKAYDEACSCR